MTAKEKLEKIYEESIKECGKFGEITDIMTPKLLSLIDQEKKKLSAEQAHYLEGLTMTEAVELSKDKDKEARKMVAQIQKKAVKDFGEWLLTEGVCIDRNAPEHRLRGEMDYLTDVFIDTRLRIKSLTEEK